MKQLPLYLLLLCFVLSFSATVHAEDKNSQQQNKTLDVQVSVKLNYLLYLPEDYEKQESWPVLLFLHGSGERGDDLEKVKFHGPPKLIEQGKEFPFIVVSPQCPEGYWWEPIELIALLDEINSNYNVDETRIYVTGLSMGGFGSWRLAAYAPDRIAAIAPICGGGEPYWAKRIGPVPVWAFHGAKDTGVPPERSLVMIDALNKVKANPKFKAGDNPTPKITIYPEARHDSWSETYNNPELYKWFLQQKKN